MIEDVFRLSPERTTNLAISDSGTLVYIPGGIGSTIQGTLVWVDREGHEEPLEEEPKTYDDPKISPDGTQVALSITADGNKDIYIYDLVRGGTKRQLTLDNAIDFKPIWTPDGQWIIFSSDRGGKLNTYRKKADGSGKVEEIVSVPGGASWPCSISSDGNTLFFVQFTDAASGNSIGMLSMAGDDRTPSLLLQDEYDKQNPLLSPDGRWLAYSSNQSGQYEIFVCSFPDVEGGGKWQVSKMAEILHYDHRTAMSCFTGTGAQ